MSSKSSALDPTHPVRWGQVRRTGKVGFLLKYGISAVGIPVALITNIAFTWMRGDADLLLSQRNAIELTFTLLLVGPLVGALVGHALWARGERRSGHLNSRAFTDASIAPLPVIEADREQRSLSELRDRLEALGQTSPQRLRWRVIGMTTLGYGYVILVSAAIAAGVVWLATVDGSFDSPARQGAWMLGAFGVFLLSALWVRLLEPRGRVVSRAGSPALFAVLDEIRQTLDAPLPDVVLIDGELNAHVAEIPTYGIFGFPKRYLVIGLPLFEALPCDECRAILSHELAHLSRRHARRLKWVVRLSVSWQNLATSLEAGRHWGRLLFLPFFRWYAPRFELHVQAVARRDEHESDALAADYVGAAVTARALLRFHINQRFLAESFLPTINRKSADSPEPPSGVYERMAVALRAGPAREDVVRWLRSALKERTLASHTHPSLADRVARLGVDLSEGDAGVVKAADLLYATGGNSGADELLGRARLPKLRAQVESEWQLAVLDTWRGWHADAQVWRSADDAEPARWTSEVLWARARWATNCETSEAALPLVREVLRRNPTHLEAKAYLGRLLSDSGDEQARAEGIRIMEDVLRRDTAFALLACATLEAQYARLGLAREVERVQTRERQLNNVVLRSFRERAELRAGDRLTGYVVPEQTLATLRKACAAQKGIARAYLVRKQTEFLRDQPFVVMAIECDVSWYKLADGAAALPACEALLKRVTLPEAADLLILPVEPGGKLQRRLESIADAELYRRK